MESLFIGAGEGNRTPVISLGSFYSTIELRPRNACILCYKNRFGKRYYRYCAELCGVDGCVGKVSVIGTDSVCGVAVSVIANSLRTPLRVI